MACESFWIVYAVSRSLVQGLIFFNIAKTGALPVVFGTNVFMGLLCFLLLLCLVVGVLWLYVARFTF